VDDTARQHFEIDGKEEIASGEDCENVEANGRRDSAEGVQYGIIARLAPVILIFLQSKRPASRGAYSFRT
jgi:hypothetical protein